MEPRQQPGHCKFITMTFLKVFLNILKTKQKGKGLFRFKSKILQDHCKSHLRWLKPPLALPRRWEAGLLFSKKLCLPSSREENKSQDLSHPTQKLTWKGHENICQTFFRAKDTERRPRFPLHAAVLVWFYTPMRQGHSVRSVPDVLKSPHNPTRCAWVDVLSPC